MKKFKLYEADDRDGQIKQDSNKFKSEKLNFCTRKKVALESTNDANISASKQYA